MKKILLMAIFAIGIVFASNAKEVFCEILGTYLNITASRIRIEVDFGEEQRNRWSNENVLYDSSGKPMKFNTMVDALNYLSQFGWKFKSAYYVGLTNSQVVHWLMSKEVENDEEIKEGIIQKRDQKY